MTAADDWVLDPTWRQRALDALESGRAAARSRSALVLVIVLGGGSYGASIGAWRGGGMVLLTAIKLPLALLVTTFVTLMINALLGRLLGLRIGIGQTLTLTLLAMAATSALLGALAPVSWWFQMSAEAPGADARTAHNLLYLLHVAMVAWAGLVGSSLLLQGLDRFTRSRATRRRVYACWTLTMALVGGQVCWSLRPFVGSIYEPIALVREDALDGNVYEFIVTDIVPHLLRGTNSGEEKIDEP